MTKYVISWFFKRIEECISFIYKLVDYDFSVLLTYVTKFMFYETLFKLIRIEYIRVRFFILIYFYLMLKLEQSEFKI